MANAGRVIGKVLRGNGVAGLLRYLFGPGRAHEHTDPHVVARWDDDGALIPAETRPDQTGRRRLARLLEQPLAALTRQPSTTVWHCSLRAAPADPPLSDEQWAEVARQVLDRTGLAPREDDDRLPVGRGPARRRPHPPGRHPRPPGRPHAAHVERLLPGRRGLPLGRADLRPAPDGRP